MMAEERSHLTGTLLRRVARVGFDTGDDDEGFARFERFLEDWSRRDFLKRMGGAAAYAAFSAGVVEFLEACGGGGTPSTSLTPVKGGNLIEGTSTDISTLHTLNSRYRANPPGYLQSVPAQDPQTVVFQFSKVLANFVDTHCRYGILPKHILGSVTPKALNTHTFFQGPTVSSGVFTFTRWDKGQQVVLARTDGYWGGKSNLDQYIFKSVTAAVVLAQQLKTGELDVGQPNATQFDNLKTATNIAAVSFINPGFVYYRFNLAPGSAPAQPFGDKNGRKALHTALDRTAMAKAAYFGQAVPADSVEAPTTWAYNTAVTPKYAFDKAKAEQMLDAAGWMKVRTAIRTNATVNLTFHPN